MIKLLFTYIFALFPILANAQPSIYIYSGPGVSKESLAQTRASLDSLLKPRYRITYITSIELIYDSWDKDAVLLIIPGGADVPYTKELNGFINRKIRTYVEKGGAFLGICAGGYYAGQFVEFAKGTPLEVRGARQLAFFPGMVRGPILAPYDYLTDSGARAARIRWNDSIVTLYYNGGGYFVDAKKKRNVTVLGSYDLQEECAALIECRVGAGKAILSGVHFEYDPFNMDENEYLEQIIPTLQASNSSRIQLLQHVLERLNIR